MYPLKKISLWLLLCGIITVAGSWGFLVHKTVHQLAVYQLPKKMQRFFYKNFPYLETNAVRADERRSTDKTEAPKHFIDIEAYGDSAAYKMPLQWDSAVAIYSKDTLLKYGYLPYHIMYMQHKLIDAFKGGNVDSILFYTADLGHYVEDANVPLHTALNYDGQLTNQKGIHALWETAVPELTINQFNLYSRHKATYLKHPEENVWEAIRRAHGLLPELFAKEKEVSLQFNDSTKHVTKFLYGHNIKVASTAFAKAYAAVMHESINAQLIYSANLVSDFWYTAWVDAGKPDLGKLLAAPFAKADRKALRLQLKSYKQNHLIQDSLLLSKSRGTKAEE